MDNFQVHSESCVPLQPLSSYGTQKFIKDPIAEDSSPVIKLRSISKTRMWSCHPLSIVVLVCDRIHLMFIQLVNKYILWRTLFCTQSMHIQFTVKVPFYDQMYIEVHVYCNLLLCLEICFHFKVYNSELFFLEKVFY